MAGLPASPLLFLHSLDVVTLPNQSLIVIQHSRAILDAPVPRALVCGFLSVVVELSLPMLLIILPFTHVLVAISVVESALRILLAVDEFSLVSKSAILV